MACDKCGLDFKTADRASYEDMMASHMRDRHGEEARQRTFVTEW